MSGNSDGAELPSVTKVERGKAIEERLTAVGIKPGREWEREAGSSISRQTLAKAIAGDPKVRDTTYDAIEAEVARLERRFAGFSIGPADVVAGEDDYVEFSVEGNFGVRAVVKGPIRDMAQLQAAASQLVRDMQTRPTTARTGDDPGSA